MSRIVDSIKSAIPAGRLDVRLSRVGIYAFMTAVHTHRLGFALTLLSPEIFKGEARHPVRHMGAIEDLAPSEVLAWTDSRHPLERSIAMATLNSCIPFDGLSFYAGNALDLAARLGAGKRVVVVGHFPDLEPLASAAASLTILEKRPQPGDLPAEAAPDVIPQADVVAATGVTCLNDTLEGLLALKRPGSIFIALGPTAPLSPVLFDFGVDIVAGAWAEDERLVASMIAQGATPRVLDGFRFVLLPGSAGLVEGCDRIEPPAEHPERPRPTVTVPPDWQTADGSGFESVADEVFSPIYPFLLRDLCAMLGRDARGLNVLEIGCGPGHMAREFLRADVDSLVLVDLCPSMLALARQRLAAAASAQAAPRRSRARKGARAGRLAFCQGDASRLPIGQARFDVVFSRGSIQFWPDLKAAVRGIARALVPGGMAYVGVGFGIGIPHDLKSEVHRKWEQRMAGGERSRIPRLDHRVVFDAMLEVGGEAIAQTDGHGWWIAWWPTHRDSVRTM